MLRRYLVSKAKDHMSKDRDTMVSKDGASSRSSAWTRKKQERKQKRHSKRRMQGMPESPPTQLPVSDSVVLFDVGKVHTHFAAHEVILSHSPFFSALLKDLSMERQANKMIDLPDEEPEIFSCILEFLYKGDYYPRLLYDTELENAATTIKTPSGNRNILSSATTIHHSGVNDIILRDTAVYCAADKYGLEDLKELALRKQGLQTGVSVPVILRSAQYAYDNTSDSESQLRAHYLAMIIRTREIFKKSGTMQIEMEKGHAWFFDLFVAMCNHLDDLEDGCDKRSSLTS